MRTSFFRANKTLSLSKSPRVLLLLLIFLLPLSVLPVVAQNTVSKPVGLVHIEVGASDQELSSIPFTPFDDAIDILLEGQLTGASTMSSADQIHKWDSSSQNYDTAFKADGTGNSARDGFWFEDDISWVASGLTFNPGDAFWLENNQTGSQSVFMFGQVVLDSTKTLTLENGLNLFSYPFSTKVALNSTTLESDGAEGSTVPATADEITDEHQSQQKYFLLDDSGSADHLKWLYSANSVLANENLLMGRGYWYDRYLSTSFDWTESRPYADDFPSNGNPPLITNMVVNSAGDEVTLHIETTGATGEELDVFYQDVAETGSFDSSTGWDFAETDIAISGASTKAWTDDGSGGRGTIDAGYARFYLVGRADIDSDSDGVPDAREDFVYLTDSADADSDDDGTDDGDELDIGTDPLDDTSYPISISGTLTYNGAQIGDFIVLAVISAGDWTSAHTTTLTTAGAYTINDVPNSTTYWIKAFRDSDADDAKDGCEAQGAYASNPLTPSSNATGIDITLVEDP